MGEPAQWWKNIDDQMASREVRTPRRSIAVNYPNELYAHVLKAAEARGLSMTAYQRRAVLAFACYDLGLEWDAVMADEPAVTEFESGRKVEAQGRGYRFWEIVGLRGRRG